MNRLSAMMLIVRRSLRLHLLSTLVTAAGVALGAGLLMAVIALHAQAMATFTGSTAGFDAVLGARGSKLQLVLSSLYHLETSVGVLPWKMYQEVKANPAVRTAIPITIGDNYRSYRIIGTVPELFTEHEYRPGQRFGFRGQGRVFEPDRAEAVVGAEAARRLGLDIGDGFYAYHGFAYDPAAIHDHMQFVVVGVLEPTNTPIDQALWIPLEGYYRMPGHSLPGDAPGERYVPSPTQVIPDEFKVVDAVLLKFRSPVAAFQFDQRINRQGTVATLAYPVGAVMGDVFRRLGWFQQVLQVVSGLIVCVAAGAILASIYNAMHERRRSFAILRSIGAQRSVVSGAIVMEAAAIALIGAVMGWIVYAVLMVSSASMIREQTGAVVEVWAWHGALVAVPIAVTLLGAIAGLIPAVKAYSTDVARHLGPTS